ncbi:hypothetical protein ACOCEA_09055 [Maribacter sp. CXY002]|uniref:hypothetical protein n=1 Tax=Maribacter luteocoastalis TaxID=3407671 RepID=UPI003B6808F5
MESTRAEVKITDLNTSALRVERSYNNLLQFKTKLNSYLYEPTTYKQYTMREELARGVNNQLKVHLELLNTIKAGELVSETIVIIKSQLRTAKMLEDGITKYIMSLNG